MPYSAKYFRNLRGTHAYLKLCNVVTSLTTSSLLMVEKNGFFCAKIVNKMQFLYHIYHTVFVLFSPQCA